MVSKRLEYIRNLKKERGFEEVLMGAEVNLRRTVIYGKNCRIKPSAVIGTDGFGYERNEKGELEKFPHYGKVIIEDDVDIGANTTIDRGNVRDTIIGKGTKIDNLVHIAHNVEIGKNVLIVAGVVVGGSSKIGDGCFIGMNASIKEHITIGKNVIVGANTFVNRDIPDNVTVVGTPCRIIK